MPETARVCPVERAGILDNRIRRWLQNPQKILKPFITEGMTVLDVGCGPGLFSIEMAALVGASGKVIAADLQEGMLQRLESKIQGKEIESRIKLHQCQEDKIGVSENVDFALAFYMLHEVADQEEFLKEIKSILKPAGRIFIVEPKFHVSKKAMQITISRAKEIGLELVEKPEIFFSRSVILKKS